MTTAIIPTVDSLEERDLMDRPGSAYFAPGGTRLKSWVSLTAAWLLNEEELAPIISRQLLHFKNREPKKLKNPGRAV